MKKYYVIYHSNFANNYSLRWTEGEVPERGEQITRKHAIKLCQDERWARKTDPAFSGYADAYIYPEDWDDTSDCIEAGTEIVGGYIVTR